MSNVNIRPIITHPSVVREAIHTKIIEAIKAKFPIEAGGFKAVLTNIFIRASDLSHNKQKMILLAKGNASDGVFVDIDILDTSGKVVGSLHDHRIMSVPIYTNRYTFLLDGNEYNIVSQLRTKSGCYTRKRGNDTLESSFNLSKGANFKLLMDPKEGKFKIDILHTTLPMYCVLQVLGAPDSVVEQKLGKDLFDINKGVSKAQMEKTIGTLYTKLVGYKKGGGVLEEGLGERASKEEKIQKIRAYFNDTEISPDTTKLTLGTAYSHVGYDIILDAAAKIVKVFNSEEDIDERDNLEFQKVYTVEDIVKEVLQKNNTELVKIKGKLASFVPSESQKTNHADLKAIFNPVYFTKPLRNFITTSSISRLPGQINPVEIMDGAAIVTRLGEGAIQSERAIPQETRAVNLSYMGVIDPIASPESSKVGIDNRFSISAFKGDDNELYRVLIDRKHGDKPVYMRVLDTYHSVVGFPDPVHTKGKRSPDDIVPAVKEGKVIKVKASELDYQIDSPHSLSTITTNSIPFLSSNQANRLVMGAKHVQQALPLKYRDTRLVEAPMKSGEHSHGSIQDLVGSFLLPVSPCDGTVTNIDQDYIYIQDSVDRRSTHKVDYEHNLPLATKTMLTNYLKVKIGDKVKKGQILASSNFTNEDGKLALGKNLTVAYMPYHGINHEDGIVVSEGAAHKLTSEHVNRVMVTLDKLKTVDKKKYMLAFPGVFTRAQLEKIDDSGIVKKGVELEEGDPIILVIEDNTASVKNQVLTMVHKGLMQQYRDVSEVYENHYPAEVIEVLHSGNTITVLIRMEKPAVVGDKLAGSWGNKGVITKIIPDAHMVHDADGKPVDALMTPIGVIGRINPAQTLDSTLGKIATKTGAPYRIENFSINDGVGFVNDEMKKHKVSDTETLTDPITGKKVPDVFTGVQHIYKLAKTTDSNFSARGVEGPHDQDDAPTGSGEIGPKAIGGMEMNALIGHNARAVMSENNTIRNTKNTDLWRQFQYGGAYNFPKSKKTFTKFTSILKQAGVNVVREGDDLKIGPLTDAGVLEMSSGEVVAKDKDALLLSPKFVPEIGGLFDPVIFGGMKGTRWGHVKLEEPTINPVFEDCVRAFLGGTKQSVLQTLYQEGGEALKKRLNAIDVAKELKATEENLKSPKFTGDALDKQVKRLKYLRALQEQGLKPGDAYMQSVVPITPPYLRPITISATGDKTESDSNKLYRDLILQNNTFKKMKEAGLDDLPGSRESLYTRVRELSGVLSPESPLLRNRGVKGALAYIAGDTPKQGFFQRKVIYSKMNLTGRATIAPDNTLGMDEVGMPIDMAWSLYKPFVLRKLTQLGKSVMEAKKEVEVRSKVATKLLEEELRERPVMVNRAPTLWRNSIFSAYPVLREGKTFKVNTLWESSSGQDYDGDCCVNSVIYRQKLNYRNQEYTLNFCEESPHSLLQEDDEASIVDAQIIQNNTVLEEEEMPFAKDTTVRYLNGLINLEDFPRIEETKEVVGNKEKYKVPQNIEVFTVKDGVGAWLPVDEFSIHHNLKMVECITNTKRSVLCSIDHSLVSVDEDLNYVKAVPNVGLTIPRVVAESNGGALKSITLKNSNYSKYQSKPEIPLNYDFGWVIGAMIGDGWADNGNNLCIAKRDVSFREKVMEVLQSCLDGTVELTGGVQASQHMFNGHDSYSEKLQMKCYPLYTFIKETIGQGAGNKHLPDFWMETSIDFRKGLLAGLIDSDGTVSEIKAVSKKHSQWNIQYSSISKRLIFELVALANSLGMTATASFSKITDAGNEAWAVVFTTESIAKIQRELVLYHSKKSERLAGAEISLSGIGRRRCTPRISEKRLLELRTMMAYPNMRTIGVARTDDDKRELQNIRSAINTVISKKDVLSEFTANKIINFLMRVPEDKIDQCIPRTDPFWIKWAAMVIDPNIKWDMIESLKAVPEITTGYDLTIPPAYTMVTESGLVVWDTETVHVPVTRESVEDAKRMLPSNMVFSDKKIGDILQFPKGETVAGLYKATKNLGAGGQGATVAPKRFHNEAEAWSAYYAGSLKATDPVEIG